MKFVSTLPAIGILLCCAGSSYADTPANSDFKPGFMDEEVGGELLTAEICKPEYPRASLRNEETGVVRLDMLIGKDGSVIDGKISQTSGFRNLDYATLQATMKCIYRPHSKAGKPFQQKHLLQYVWRLE
jgi:TonB family protein